MNLILYAIPGFLLLLAAEIALDRYRKTGYHRANDTLASLSTGLLSQTMSFATRFLSFMGYAVLWTVLPHGELTMTPLLWVIAFVFYDFCYYWSHRCQHMINILWGVHVVHHQSEEFNLSTALRQPFNGFWIGGFFYLPMLFVGFPPEVIVLVGSLNLIYQYWVHTRFITTLGWLEKILVTPMNHRVHHAINDAYIDRNFGGVFILWDRLLGTYQAELAEHPCVFGVRKPLHSWNPFFANFHVYWQLLQDAWHAEKWSDKFRLWFMPTGWRPADVAARYPLLRCLPDNQQKYDALPPQPILAAAIAVHLFLMGFTIWFLLQGESWSFSLALAHFLPLGGGLWINSRILEQRRMAIGSAFVFWLFCAALPWWLEGWLLNPASSSFLFLVLAVLMPAMAFWSARQQGWVVSGK
ncbi:MAG: sterol desaturase family protein [Pseudomonadales bacterium]|nr:sterol desaturase family protein [Pseudomonadales bacterium]